MRLGTVFAVAFGPFRDRALHLAPGMTVVWGLNESGKSSWHAALYAALCGMRRGRGAARKEDRDFIDKHRPWEGLAWEASVLLELDDGRRIELRQDLEQGAGSKALDADLGRDLSSEILNDGSPDGSRWLGLDRRSFLAVSCVRQADILGVLLDASVLQEHLQRAAATAGTDATAAAAIERLGEYRREHVGQDRANSTKPLKRAKEALDAARTGLDAARAQHERILLLAAQALDLGAASSEAARRLRLTEAARARHQAETWQRRLERARLLATGLPDGPPPDRTTEDALGVEVAAAIAAWRERPEIPVLEGRTAAELRAQIAALPAEPQGDVEQHPDVALASQEFERWRQALDLHESERPDEPASPEAPRLSEEDLLRLAASLETSPPPVDLELQERVDAVTKELGALPGPAIEQLTTTIAAFVAAAGLACVLFEKTQMGVVLLTLGIGALLLVATRSSAAVRARKLEELRQAEAALGDQRHASVAAEQRKSSAAEEIRAHGLSPDPDSLRVLAGAREQSRQKRFEFNHWTARRRQLADRAAGSEARLVAALGARGVDVAAVVVAPALAAYRGACTDRQRAAAEAARRPDLESQLAARDAAEGAALATEKRRALAEERLRQAASKCGVGGDSDQDLLPNLTDWQELRRLELASEEKKRVSWSELQLLLEGRDLEELAAETERHLQEARRLWGGLGEEEIGAEGTPSEADLLRAEADLLHADIELLRAEAREAARGAAEAQGRLNAEKGALRSVAEAEEQLSEAEADLVRVQRLDETLALTIDFLGRAQERVHRDIARLLADTIRPWLPMITAHRYTDIMIDPGNLEVRVSSRAGAWRAAALLSHGTAEQVYLLLRMALAKHLTKPGETAPLILDDITVQCDRARKIGVLSLLHAISRERQVILFTQEDEVAAWAEAHLKEPRDRLDRLDDPASPA